MTKQLSIAILGASGYTGAELIRLLRHHPSVAIKALTADSKAGQPIAAIYPHLVGLGLPDLVKHESVDWSGIDAVFCCLPHGTTQEIVAKLPAHLKVVDLSADFRLRDVASYAQWYGHAHSAVALQAEAVYGLVEQYRADIKKARLVACPGCYPTSILLPLLPLLKAGAIDANAIIADSKSGITGAGRAAKEANLFTELNEGINAYGIGNHRHTPEIEQELSVAAGAHVEITFTPHLMPMNRGILSTLYVTGKSAAEIKAILEKTYKDEPFVTVLPGDSLPSTRQVRGSNRCVMNVFAGRK
ncbi:MAG: N-acetyl-gamma-glutamyl-phosphate reductase, partial [Alphaproteobacteria bacterium]|nr:N-acetyl-gamma-glutamyl-phosphate reductase [Alphaproteobacteria bacterium]